MTSRATKAEPGGAKVGTFTQSACPTCGHKRAVFNGAHFRLVRERAGVTLRDMAKRLNVCAAYVSDMELGKRRFLVKYVLPYRRLAR